MSNQNVAAARRGRTSSARRWCASSARRSSRRCRWTSARARGSGGHGSNGGAEHGHRRRRRPATATRLGLGATGSPTSGAASPTPCRRASASAQASAADLAAARLSAQGELGDRLLVAARGRLRGRPAAHARSRATSARCRSRRTATPPAIAPKTDVLQAQTQLANAQADARRGARSSARSCSSTRSPCSPARRRPTSRSPAGDWNDGRAGGAARRAVDAAAAPARHRRGRAPGRGRQRADRHRSAPRYFPIADAQRSLGNARARALGDLFNASNALWSLGVSLAQTVFDAGATRGARRGAAGGARSGRRALPADRAGRVPGRRGPARRRARRWSEQAGAAQAGLARPPTRPSSRC